MSRVATSGITLNVGSYKNGGLLKQGEVSKNNFVERFSHGKYFSKKVGCNIRNPRNHKNKFQGWNFLVGRL